MADSLQPRVHVLFDLDGVLLDTEPLYTQAAQSIVGRFGKTYDWSIKQHTMGRDARVGATLVVERLEIPMTVDEYLEEQKVLLSRLLVGAPAKSGAEAFVRSLGARGIPMAVATSSNRWLFDLKARGHRWFDAFQAVVCGDDARVRSKKPAPDIFLAAAMDLGAAPEECVVFEDSIAGLEAALAAGMRAILIPDPALDWAAFGAAHRIIEAFDDVSDADLEPLRSGATPR